MDDDALTFGKRAKAESGETTSVGISCRLDSTTARNLCEQFFGVGAGVAIGREYGSDDGVGLLGAAEVVVHAGAPGFSNVGVAGMPRT
jgi:hypothetical protein